MRSWGQIGRRMRRRIRLRISIQQDLVLAGMEAAGRPAVVPKDGDVAPVGHLYHAVHPQMGVAPDLVANGVRAHASGWLARPGFVAAVGGDADLRIPAHACAGLALVGLRAKVSIVARNAIRLRGVVAGAGGVAHAQDVALVGWRQTAKLRAVAVRLGPVKGQSHDVVVLMDLDALGVERTAVGLGHCSERQFRIGNHNGSGEGLLDEHILVSQTNQ